MPVTDGTPAVLRAGGEPRGIPALASTYRTLLADVSGFQPDVDDPVYLAWSKAVVVRAMYGADMDDGAWYGGARREALHAGGAVFVGIYQFLVPGQDGATQARALARLLGPLRPGELPIADLETGAGDQAAVWEAWRAEILAAYPQLARTPAGGPWLYSGLDFAAARGLRPQWVAAYQADEPGVPHQMWQFTAAYPVPGIGTCDCSVYHGTAGQLAALTVPAPVTPKPAPAPVAEGDDMPYGSITAAQGARQSVTWPAGTVTDVTVFSDWGGLQAAAPGISLRVSHKTGPQVYDAGIIPMAGTTGSYTITSPADCNGVSFTRLDAGAATVAWHAS
jgi:hypothetical protein